MADTGWFTFSFWMDDIDKDLWPRTRIYIHYCDSNNNCPNLSLNFAERMVRREGGRGLYEEHFHIGNPGQIIRLRYVNKVVTKGEIILDNILVQRRNEDVLTMEGSRIFLNNREVHDLSEEEILLFN